MSDKQIYEVLIKEGDQILRYLFETKTVEYYFEPVEKMKLEEAFREAHYNKGRYEVIEIRPSDFVDFIKI